MSMTPQQAFEEALGASRNYVKKSLVGMGALKGAPCEIQSIETTDTANIITFKWEDSSGTTHTDSITVTNGTFGYSPQISVLTDTDEEYILQITYYNTETEEEVTITTPNLRGGVEDSEFTDEQVQSLISLL